MKRLKIIRFITITILILFFIFLLTDAIVCMNMTYPHPMLGLDATNWFDQFIGDLTFIFIFFGLPLIIDIIILIITSIKIKKFKDKSALSSKSNKVKTKK